MDEGYPGVVGWGVSSKGGSWGIGLVPEVLLDFFEGMTIEGSYSVLEEQPRWMVHELICVVYKTFQEFLKEFQAVLMFSRIFRKVLVRLAETLRDLRSDHSRVLEGVPGIWELFCRLSGIKETCWGSWEDCFSCRMEVWQDALTKSWFWSERNHHTIKRIQWRWVWDRTWGGKLGFRCAENNF